jgi:hypothetical protein
MKVTADNFRSKMSVRQASEAYSVPNSSLHDRLMKLTKGRNVIIAPDMGTFRRTFLMNKKKSGDTLKTWTVGSCHLQKIIWKTGV